MGEIWKFVYPRLHERCLPLQRFTAPIASALTLASGFCSSRPLRLLCLLAAVVLFLTVATDFARSLLDREPAGATQPGSHNLPVTPTQIFLSVIVASVYAAMMFVGLSTVVTSSWIAFFVMSPGIVVLSSLAAWHNVRLWYREGEDYEQVLKEEEGQSHKLHIPPVR
jgi:hypothetical protein